MVKVQTKIDTIMFKTDKDSHIKLDQDKCRICKDKPCLKVCPAEMFTLSADKSEVVFSHEGCLECGTCYIICEHLKWQYPRGGYGVVFREV